MSALLNLQSEFTRCVMKLILFANSNGYELTFGDAYRDPRVPYGHDKSAHKRRLAVDFNLIKDGVWLETTEDHAFLGRYWKTLHPMARWGGDFGDGNHYSFEWNGIK